MHKYCEMILDHLLMIMVNLEEDIGTVMIIDH